MHGTENRKLRKLGNASIVQLPKARKAGKMYSCQKLGKLGNAYNVQFLKVGKAGKDRN